MHDEAATHFMGMMDQTTLGHNFLKETFDFTPSVGWQIDPFGHSSTQASLLSADAGFDALYFGRIDYQDLSLRRDSRRVEGIWRASAAQKDSAEVFWGLTGSYGGNYGPPGGFCFDNFCSDEPMMDQEDLEDYNVDEKVADFVSASFEQANQARGTSIMMTMGSDFQYENSEVWFRNLDSVIKNVNEFNEQGKIAEDPYGRFSGIKVFYSNPNEYTLAKNKDSLEWEVKTDDFFPYSDCENCFWTGYFTSRAELKKFERVGSSFLQAARQIEAMVGDDEHLGQFKSTFDSPTHKLDAAVGVVQHHDGVSGTAKQHVAFDYSKRIDVGFKKAASFMSDAINKLGLEGDFTVCQGLNVSVCEITQTADFENEKLFSMVYNSFSHSRSELISVPVAASSADQEFDVRLLKTGESVPASLVPTANPVDDAASDYTLYFKAENLPPLGALVYEIAPKQASPSLATESAPVSSGTATSRKLRGSTGSPISVSNGKFDVEFDSNGRLMTVAGNKVEQSWGYYTSFDSSRSELGGTPVQGTLPWTPGVPGTCLPGYLDAEGDEERWLRDSDGQNSGAYIFRPSRKDESLTVLEPSSTPSSVEVVQTDLVTEVHAAFGDWVKQVTRVAKDSDFVEIEWTVGPVPTDDGIGKEVVTKFDTDISSGNKFYTDSNGREFLERTIDYRPTWDLEVFQPVAGNYYPVNAAIYIEDSDSSLAVLNDRTQGGASLSSGSIELMVQRRLTADDSRGVGEPLDETTGGVTPYPPYGDAIRVGDGVIIKGTHRIAVGAGNSGASTARKLMEPTFLPPTVFFTKRGKDEAEASSVKPGFATILDQELPAQLSLITMQKVADEKGTFLVRIGHMYGENEDEQLSKPAQVDLSKLLPNMQKWKEMTLTGNQERASFEANRLQWKGQEAAKSVAGRELDQGDLVTIKPMEIRTFRIVMKEGKGLATAM